jgi:hypothetical protein
MRNPTADVRNPAHHITLGFRYLHRNLARQLRCIALCIMNPSHYLGHLGIPHILYCRKPANYNRILVHNCENPAPYRRNPANYVWILSHYRFGLAPNLRVA